MNVQQLKPLIAARKLRLDRALNALRAAAELESRCREARDAAAARRDAAIDERRRYLLSRAARMQVPLHVADLATFEQRAKLLAEQIIAEQAQVQGCEKRLSVALEQRSDARRTWQAAQRRVEALQQLAERSRRAQQQRELRAVEHQIEDRGAQYRRR